MSEPQPEKRASGTTQSEKGNPQPAKVLPYYKDPNWDPDWKDYPPYNVTDMINDVPYFGPSIDRPRKKRNPPGPYNFGLVMKGDKNKKKLSSKVLTDEIIQLHSTETNNRLVVRNRCLTNVDAANAHPRFVSVNFAINRITSIESLSALQNLKILNLEQNRIWNPAHVPTFNCLHALSLMGNLLIDTSEFCYQPNLHVLNLSRNNISCLLGLDLMKFPKLRCLELRHNKLFSLEGLILPELRHLYIAENKLRSLVDLSTLPNLISCHARQNKIASLSNFPRNLRHLMYLNLRDNLVSKHTEVIKLGRSPLRALILTGCPITFTVKYRVETITSVIGLIRLDKSKVLQADVSTAMYLRKHRRRGNLPLVQNEPIIDAPPPSPVSALEALKSAKKITKLAKPKGEKAQKSLVPPIYSPAPTQTKALPPMFRRETMNAAGPLHREFLTHRPDYRSPSSTEIVTVFTPQRKSISAPSKLIDQIPSQEELYEKVPFQYDPIHDSIEETWRREFLKETREDQEKRRSMAKKNKDADKLKYRGKPEPHVEYYHKSKLVPPEVSDLILEDQEKKVIAECKRLGGLNLNNRGEESKEMGSSSGSRKKH